MGGFAFKASPPLLSAASEDEDDDDDATDFEDYDDEMLALPV